MNSIGSSGLSDSILPPEIWDRSAWRGPDLKDRTDWIERLSEIEIDEVQRAVNKLTNSSVDVAEISKDDFPLPVLGARLQNVLDEVINGRGFVLIRALPVWLWTKREAALAFLGLGVHLGVLRMQ